jgi:TrkA domain protein
MARRRSSVSAVRLPGIGERLDVLDTSGHMVQIVRRHDGSVSLYTASGDVVELDAATAGQVGAFASGHYLLDPALAERVGDVLGGLVFDWVRLDPGDRAVGRSIAELEVRRRTGITIVAILRGSIPIVAPDPDTRLQAGDDLVIAGSDQDRDDFIEYLARAR